jgi:hypothetical protein
MMHGQPSFHLWTLTLVEGITINSWLFGPSSIRSRPFRAALSSSVRSMYVLSGVFARVHLVLHVLNELAFGQSHPSVF